MYLNLIDCGYRVEVRPILKVKHEYGGFSVEEVLKGSKFKVSEDAVNNIRKASQGILQLDYEDEDGLCENLRRHRCWLHQNFDITDFDLYLEQLKRSRISKEITKRYRLRRDVTVGISFSEFIYYNIVLESRSDLDAVNPLLFPLNHG